MGLKRCGACGVPRQVILTQRWRDDGIIETKPVGTREVVILERELVGEVFQGIQDKLGIPIDHIIFEAKRKDAVLYADGILTGTLGILRWKPLRKSAFKFLVNQSAAIGLGYVELLRYKPGRQLIGRINPVYHKALFTGDVTGGFESIERTRAHMASGDVGEWLYIDLLAREDEPEEERLTPVESKVVEARAEYNRCSKCGVPEEISRFRWVREKGQIIDTATGEWVFVIGRGGFGTVIKVLEEELGTEVTVLVAELTRRFYRRLIERQPGEVLLDLSFLGSRGMGVPETVKPCKDDLAKGLAVRNPFNPPIIAGIVAAVCGADEGTFSWSEPEEGIVEVRSC